MVFVCMKTMDVAIDAQDRILLILMKTNACS